MAQQGGIKMGKSNGKKILEAPEKVKDLYSPQITQVLKNQQKEV
jgi:hypothetical protein